MKTKVAHFCYCVALLLGGCHGQNVDMIPADLKRLKPFTASSKVIPVIILEKFEAMPCKQNAVNANVYKVKHVSQGDTLFVFVICKEMWGNEDNVLFVVEKSPEVTDQILIPSNSNIPNGSKYLVGNLKRAIY